MPNTAQLTLAPGDALIVVDVQRDFLPGGSLVVPSGNAVVPVLNRYLARFRTAGGVIVASRDWHPPAHCSFKEQGGPWPVHCVMDTEGARFAPDLALPPSTLIVSKGARRDADAYSAFEGTDLHECLKAMGVRRVFIGGLATDYCVRQTVTDALGRGYEVVLLQDAIRAVDVKPRDGRKAEEEMIRRGAVPIREEQLADGP